MEVLRQISAHSRQCYASATPRVRIASALLLATIVASVAFLAQQEPAESYEYLFGDEPFSSGQIPQVVAALATVGNDFEVDDNRVRVPHSKRDAYIAAVANAGALPRNLDSIMTEALEGGSFLESRETKRWRNQAARESQLSHIIGLMPWVEQASVIFTIEESRALSREQQASATVSILPKPGELLDGQRLRNLQRFVAGWHPSLHWDKVTVINLGDENGTTPAASEVSEDCHRIRTAYEKLKRDRVQEVLSYIPGVRVQVSARLEQIVEEPYRDVISKPLKGRGTTAAGAVPEISAAVAVSGPPSLDAQGPNHNANDDEIGKLTKPETTQLSSKDNDDSASEHELQRAGCKVIDVIASVTVPRQYILQVWKQRNSLKEKKAPRESNESQWKTVQTEEVRKIEDLIRPLLSQRTDGEAGLTKLHVDVAPSLADGYLPQEPTLAANALAWTGQHGTALSMLGLAAFAILLMRSVFRLPFGSPRSVGPSASPAVQDRPRYELPVSRFNAPQQLPHPPQANSPRRHLAEVVGADPDAAATILQTWIRTAS